MQAIRESFQTPLPQTAPPAPLTPMKQSSPVESSRFSSSTRSYFPPENSNLQVSASSTCLKIIMPPRILTLIGSWIILGLVLAFAYPVFPLIWNYIAELVNVFWVYIISTLILILLVWLLVGVTLSCLETVTLEITEKETRFMRSIFGKTSWQVKVLTSSFQGVEPQWRMIEKRNSGILDDLRSCTIPERVK